MRLLAVLLAAAACSSSAKPAAESTTTSSVASSPPTATSASTTTTTTTSTTSTRSGSAPTGPAKYSCFSYVQNGSQLTRHACMRTAECGPYLEQAKSVGGIRETSGCANVPSVYCFHQVATKDEPDGLDICQPSLDECKTARADVVRAKMSVDSDCGPR